MDYIPWTERYRPATLDAVAGQKDILESLKSFVKQTNMPHLLFTGPAGVGKTSCAIALAKDLFKENIGASFLELNASDERGIDIIRGKIKDFARSVSLAEVPFKIIFLDEADSLTPDAQHALRRTMELFSSVTRFIMSCNYSSKIIEPLQSRCSVFRFSPLKYDDIMATVTRIAASEKLQIDENALKALFYVSEGDMRKIINTLQGVAMISSHLTEEAVHKVTSRARPDEIRKMLEHALQGKFTDAKAQLLELMLQYGMSGEDVIVQIHRSIPELSVTDKEKVRVLELVGEYNFRLVEGANERIQLDALLAQLSTLRAK